MNTYIGLDLGTSVIKGMAINDQGKVLCTFAKESPLVSRQVDWAEQSPEMWWSSMLEILHLIGTKIQMKSIKGLGISGQMHGLVTYDEKYSVPRRAIVWLDKRSTKEAEMINTTLGEKKVYQITGNPMFTGFLLPSLTWVKKNEPDVYAKIAKVSSPKDYLAYRLTGTLMCEPTDALATGAFDYSKGTWSKDILQAAGISEGIFPEIKPTHVSYGGITKKISKITGIPEGIPVYGASDQSMAALGSGLIKEGQSVIAISTGGQFLVIAEKGIIDKKQRLHTLNHALSEVSLYMAATLSAGFSLRWFKNEITGEQDTSYPEFLEDIDTIDLGSGGLFYLPYLAGERTPYFNPNLRGAFIGLSHSHTRKHMIRAIMEGVAFSMKDCLEVFKEMGINIPKIILSGGGTKDALWRQIITDVINIPTETINIEDHSPFGAAIMAKFAQEGFEKLPEWYEQVIHAKDSLYPNELNVAKYEELFTQYKAHALHLNATLK